MEQQETKLPLEWLSSRRTPELHRLEALCRETAREERCAQRRLQEVEEAMASEQEKSCPEALPAASGPTQLEQLSRKLNAANAELRRYETRMFAYERTILALRKENADLSARCDVLHAEVEKLAAEALKPLPELPPLPTISFPGDEKKDAEQPPEAAVSVPAPPAAPARPKTRLEHLGDEVLAQLARLMPGEKES